MTNTNQSTTDMKRRTIFAVILGALIPKFATATEVIPRARAKSKAKLKSFCTGEKDFGCVIGIGIEFEDEECRWRRLAFEVLKGSSPEELAIYFRAMAEACEDPDHRFWVRGCQELTGHTITQKMEAEARGPVDYSPDGAIVRKQRS